MSDVTRIAGDILADGPARQMGSACSPTEGDEPPSPVAGGWQVISTMAVS